MAKERKKEKRFKWVVFLITIFFIFVLTFFIFKSVYREKVYPGVKAGSLDLSGKTKEESFKLLSQFTQKFNQEGIIFIAENDSGKTKRVKVSPIIISPQDPDLSREILSFDIKKTAEDAYFMGRQGNFLNQLKDILNIFVFLKKVNINYHLDREELDKILKTNFENFENPASNAVLKINNQYFEILPEKKGFTFNYQEGLNNLEENISNLIYQPVNLKMIVDFPEITKMEGEAVINQADLIAKTVSLKLIYKEYWWRLSDIKPFISLKSDKISKEVFIGLDQEKFFNYLEEAAKNINLEPKDAEFDMKEGRVAIFKPSVIGRKLNIEKSFERIEKELIKEKKLEIELLVDEKGPKISTAEINNLGINELIGTGASDFSGSPQNRRHNIKTGAEKLNGILIKPDEEFSLNEALGGIGPDEGYLPELVIKGSRTIPEYGGGLCQVGTTAFRVALNSGLPITERRPHSYRVSYYEPAGMDATIYNPWPDLKFINDTPSHILFLTRIEGDELIFEFWGTSDGRKIEISEPKVFNIVKPGAARYIETEELAPGEKKLIERAHDGADAEFVRVVIYPNKEEPVEEVWKSHYKPWQTVYLIGKAPTSSEEILEE